MSFIAVVDSATQIEQQFATHCVEHKEQTLAHVP